MFKVYCFCIVMVYVLCFIFNLVSVSNFYYAYNISIYGFFVKAFINLFSGSSNEGNTSKAEEKPLLSVLEQGKKQLEAIKKDASNFADQIDDNISKAIANIRGRGRGAVKSKAPPISSKVKGKDKGDSSPRLCILCTIKYMRRKRGVR